MTYKYPNDADGDALRRVASSSNDMSRPMDIDFQIAASDEAVANCIAEEADRLGYRTSVYFDNEEADGAELWTCECTKSIVPTYDSIVASQSELDAIARPMGAYADGWGTFGNADSAATAD